MRDVIVRADNLQEWRVEARGTYLHIPDIRIFPPQRAATVPEADGGYLEIDVDSADMLAEVLREAARQSRERAKGSR